VRLSDSMRLWDAIAAVEWRGSKGGGGGEAQGGRELAAGREGGEEEEERDVKRTLRGKLDN